MRPYLAFEIKKQSSVNRRLLMQWSFAVQYVALCFGQRFIEYGIPLFIAAKRCLAVMFDRPGMIFMLSVR